MEEKVKRTDSDSDQMINHGLDVWMLIFRSVKDHHLHVLDKSLLTLFMGSKMVSNEVVAHFEYFSSVSMSVKRRGIGAYTG